jgi:hypothetical protein
MESREILALARFGNPRVRVAALALQAPRTRDRLSPRLQLRGEPAPAKFVWRGLKLAVLHLLASGLTRLADTPPEGLSWVQR